MDATDAKMYRSKWPDECPISPEDYDIAVRLANERVPTGVIARALREKSEHVRDALFDAQESGQIAQMPAEDWSAGGAGSAPAKRLPSDDDLAKSCIRRYHITNLQAALLVTLLKRTDCSKDILHKVINDRRRPSTSDRIDESDPKMVDVLICLMRKRLKPFEIAINTMWGSGYYIERDVRKRELAVLCAEHEE